MDLLLSLCSSTKFHSGIMAAAHDHPHADFEFNCTHPCNSLKRSCFNYSSFAWLFDWICHWLSDWSIDWCIDWLVGWLGLIGRLIDLVICWLFLIFFHLVSCPSLVLQSSPVTLSAVAFQEYFKYFSLSVQDNDRYKVDPPAILNIIKVLRRFVTEDLLVNGLDASIKNHSGESSEEQSCEKRTILRFVKIFLNLFLTFQNFFLFGCWVES